MCPASVLWKDMNHRNVLFLCPENTDGSSTVVDCSSFLVAVAVAASTGWRKTSGSSSYTSATVTDWYNWCLELMVRFLRKQKKTWGVPSAITSCPFRRARSLLWKPLTNQSTPTLCLEDVILLYNFNLVMDQTLTTFRGRWLNYSLFV